MGKKDAFLDNPLSQRKKDKDKKSFLETEASNIEVVTQANNEVIEIQNEEFDYSELDPETREFLKNKEKQLHTLARNFYTMLGQIFYDVREKLANHYQGKFSKWCSSMGISRRKVYRLINRYELIEEQNQLEKKKIIENLPLSLAYNLSKSTVPQELKELVLSQEITTVSGFKEALKEYKDESDESNKKEKKAIKQFTISQNKINKNKHKIAQELKNSTIDTDDQAYELVMKILQILSE